MQSDEELSEPDVAQDLRAATTRDADDTARDPVRAYRAAMQGLRAASRVLSFNLHLIASFISRNS